MKSSNIIANTMAGFYIFVTLLITWVIFLTFWDTLIGESFEWLVNDLSLLVVKVDLIFGRDVCAKINWCNRKTIIIFTLQKL